MHTTYRKNNRSVSGFSLIELIVVMAVIAVLATILVTAVGRVRSAADRVKSATHLRELATAVIGSTADNNGALPYVLYSAPPGNNGYGQVPWMRAVSPYLDFEWTNETWKKWASDDILRGLPDVFYCPADETTGPPPRTPYDVSYGLNSRLVGTYNGNDEEQVTPPRYMASLFDPARTILLGDAANHGESDFHGWSIGPLQPNLAFSRRHVSGAHIAWADGHVTYEPMERIVFFESLGGPAPDYWVWSN